MVAWFFRDELVEIVNSNVKNNIFRQTVHDGVGGSQHKLSSNDWATTNNVFLVCKCDHPLVIAFDGILAVGYSPCSASSSVATYDCGSSSAQLSVGSIVVVSVVVLSVVVASFPQTTFPSRTHSHQNTPHPAHAVFALITGNSMVVTVVPLGPP